MIHVVQLPPYFVSLSSGLLVYNRSRSKTVGEQVFHIPRQIFSHTDCRYATPFNTLQSAQWAASESMKHIPNTAEYHALLVMARETDPGPFYVNMPNGFLVCNYGKDETTTKGRVEIGISHNRDIRTATPFYDFETARQAGNQIAEVMYSGERRMHWYSILSTPRYAEID